VQVWLGHHLPAFTLATYVHLLPDDAPSAAFFDEVAPVCASAASPGSGPQELLAARATPALERLLTVNRSMLTGDWPVMQRILMLLVAGVDIGSAYVYAGPVSEHLHEAPPLGVAFALATALLIAFALALLVVRESTSVLRANALLFVGLCAGYALSRTAGLPVVGEGVEPVYSAGVATQFVQVAGLLCILATQVRFATVTSLPVPYVRKD